MKTIGLHNLACCIDSDTLIVELFSRVIKKCLKKENIKFVAIITKH